ncbi:cytochrome P450 (plasmid) [Deinococcus aetherius]|uniref:Cytochrome P450 n=1 Tax=Deinococcus aetherius TaxID=200252 RepID=A0ABN6RLB0_9DEIO|nr:cytochrome P450 [Deinococcus aetherius]BDP44071.1 cytochrome P450 [Deinococcus aetherius]
MTQPHPAPHTLPLPPRPEARPGDEGAASPLDTLPVLARAYGDMVLIGRTEQGAPMCLVSDPKLIEFIHVQTGRLFDKGYQNVPINTLLFGNGLVTSEGDFWLRQRRMVQPAFHRERIQAYGAVMVDAARRYVEGVRPGETRDVHSDMMHLTLDIITKTLFDLEMGERAEPFERAMNDMFEADVVLRTALRGGEENPGAFAAFQDATSRIDRFVADIIRERRAQGGEDRGDLLSTLLAAQDDERRGMTDQQLLDEAKNLIMAGHETTANTLTWAWWLLSRHPEAEKRLHEELGRELGGRVPTLADLPRLTYTNRVIQEAMRVIPPVWTVGRRAKTDMELGGFFIPAGTALIMSQWVVHHDPRWYDVPEEFQPERWAGDLEKHNPRYAFFPFGGGPRVCIGENFARMEAPLLLATIASRHAVRVLPEPPVEIEAAITLRPRHGLRATFEPRGPGTA